MSGKDISEMSFDEFFFGRKPKKEEPPRRAEASAEKTEASGIDGSRFKGGRPKLNVHGSTVTVFIPRYEGGRGARYEVSVQQGDRTVPLGRLKSSPLNSDIASIPTELDLGGSGVDPLKGFVLVIDGVRAYESFDRGHMMFNSDGMPISRPEDTTLVLRPKASHLWLGDAKIAATRDIGDLVLDTVEVAKGGYVRVRDRPQPGAEKAKAETKKEKAPKKAKATASIRLPAAETVASVELDGRPVPLYAAVPKVAIETSGADPASFVVKVEAPGRSDDVPGVSFGEKALEGASGDVEVSVVHDGKFLASARFFVVPGFSCSYNGKGDIPSDRDLTVDLGSGPITRDIYDDDLSAPYPFGDGEVRLLWNVPVATVDLGSGPVPISDSETAADDLPDSIIVTVRNASKKSVFLGGTGKKVNLTPDWVDETFRIDSKPIEDAVFSSPTRDAELYITVNSCPVRRFLRIRNDPGMAVSFSDGAVHASITGSADYVCLIYSTDRTHREVPLQKGENDIPVGPDSISADVVERRGDKVLATETVSIRGIPFLLRDDMGDVWFYVSRDKRIPLPDGLLEKRKDAAEVRRWHSQIVRMNPELKTISPELTVKAFKEFEA